jgi:hypothetical protein
MALDPARIISKRGCFWLRHIQMWQQSDQTQVSYCRGCELSVSAFRWWRYRLMREGILADKDTSARTLPPEESRSFVEISVTEPKQPMGVAPYEIILTCHRRLLIAENFEDQAVVRLLSILEHRC